MLAVLLQADVYGIFPSTEIFSVLHVVTKAQCDVARQITSPVWTMTNFVDY